MKFYAVRRAGLRCGWRRREALRAITRPLQRGRKLLRIGFPERKKERYGAVAGLDRRRPRQALYRLARQFLKIPDADEAHDACIPPYVISVSDSRPIVPAFESDREFVHSRSFRLGSSGRPQEYSRRGTETRRKKCALARPGPRRARPDDRLRRATNISFLRGSAALRADFSGRSARCRPAPFA
jgi:hypothetical protein